LPKSTAGGQHIFSGLPRAFFLAEKDGVARPGISSKIIQVGNKAGPERIEMDVPDQILEIGVFLTDDRLVAVLEEMSGTVMSSVEAGGVSGQEPCHNFGQRSSAGAQQNVNMVCQEGPCVTDGPGFRKKLSAAVEKVPPVGKTRKDRPLFYSSDDDVVKDGRRIETGAAGHEGRYRKQGENVKIYLLSDP